MIPKPERSFGPWWPRGLAGPEDRLVLVAIFIVRIMLKEQPESQCNLGFGEHNELLTVSSLKSAATHE